MPDDERQRIVYIEAKRVVSALRTHPARRDYITTLYLEPHDKRETRDLLSILQGAAPRLRTLAILPSKKRTILETRSRKRRGTDCTRTSSLRNPKSAFPD